MGAMLFYSLFNGLPLFFREFQGNFIILIYILCIERAHTHTWILRKDNSSWVTLCDSRIQMEIGIFTSCILSFEMICSGILEHGNASWRILRYHHNFWSCNASLPLCSTLQKYTISFILHHSLFVFFFLFSLSSSVRRMSVNVLIINTVMVIIV